MTTTIPYHDGLSHLAQGGSPAGVQLIRITQADQYNRYTARPVEFDEQGRTTFADEATFTVTNLAEPADEAGQVPEGTEAIAIDVEGRWVIFLRQVAPVFPARIVGSQGGASYTVREQVIDPQGAFADRTGTSDVAARNLAELSLGPGAAVDVGTIVLVTALVDGASPPTVRYVFDHPAYAKYLD